MPLKDPVAAAAYAKKWKLENRDRVNATARRFRKENPDKSYAWSKSWRDKHPDIKAWDRTQALQRRYKITPEQWGMKFSEQGECCATCKNPEHGGMGWHTDHDHATGVVRGILCHRCNLAIGHVQDSVATLKSMVEYLEKCNG
jgi:hypothetical protein